MMASDMDKFLEMSLDDYIATKKDIFRNVGNKSVGAVSKLLNNIEPLFKAEQQNSKPGEEIEDELMETELQSLGERSLLNSSDKLNKSSGIWRGPSAETNFIDLDYMRNEFDVMFNDPELQKPSEDKKLSHPKQNERKDFRAATTTPKTNTTKDLREILNNSINVSKNNDNSNKQSLDSKNKQMGNANAKWRSNLQMQQNSTSLTSINTDCGLSGKGQYRRRCNNKKNNRGRNNDGCGNRGNGGNGFVNNGGQNLYWHNNRNGGGGTGGYNNNNSFSMNNNGRIQRFNQHNNEDMLNKRIKRVLDQINSTHSICVNKQTGSVRDLTIECPTTSFTGRITAGAIQSAGQHTLQAQSTQTQSDLKALLGVNESNLKAETMAMWAGKLLDLFQTGQQQTVHKPIYDIQIQKEIHELQGKSLLYKCPSGEVVSSDGTGIENCKVTPSSSGLTLNYRFG